MIAEIISIGNELLNGKTVNTNATFIARQLYEIGISIGWIQTIGDEASAIRQALELALQRAEVVVVTGGLGPTHDDITKKTVAEFFGKALIFREDLLEKVRERFARRGIKMPEINRNQALVPEGVQLMDNPVGTALGMIFEQEGKFIFVMPGVPREMKAMMEGSVIPFLQKRCPECRVQVNLFRTTGIPESSIYERIAKDLLEFSSYEIAFLPKFTGVDVRVIRRGKDITDQDKFRRFTRMLYERIGNFIYTTEDKELEEVVGELLRERNLTIAVAESCTGGLVQDKITDVPGSSDYFMGGLVTYSNEAKMKFLGVQKESLRQHGAVSEVVAREMAAGVRQAVGTDLAVSTTGIAGPTGATPTKPVGLVYIGLASKKMVFARKFLFGNDRRINKERAAQAALDLVRRYLQGLPLE